VKEAGRNSRRKGKMRRRKRGSERDSCLWTVLDEAGEPSYGVFLG
jgi:hypothetical protein